MLGVLLGFMRRIWACRRDWPRTTAVKPVWPEEDAPPEIELLLLEGRDLVDAGAVDGYAPGRGPTGFAGKGDGEGGYLDDVRGGEMRCGALLWELLGREALAGILDEGPKVFGIGSVGAFTSGGL